MEGVVGFLSGVLFTLVVLGILAYHMRSKP